MTRYIYGGGGDAQSVTTSGTVRPNATAAVYNARSGGSLVTDILDMSNNPLSGNVTTDAFGQAIFQGPDNYWNTLWLDFSSGPRWALSPKDTKGTIDGYLKNYTFTNGIFRPGAANQVGLTVNALAGQTNSLQQWQKNGTLLDYFDYDGSLHVTTDNINAALIAGNTPSGQLGDLLALAVNGTQTFEVNSTGQIITGPTMQTYTPIWTADSGTPAIGNGSMVFRYTRFGKLFIAQFKLVTGSSTTFGTAGSNWHWTIPVGTFAAADPIGYGAGNAVGSSSSTGAFPLHAVPSGVGGNTFDLRINGQPLQSAFASVPNGVLDSTTPQTWVAGSGGLFCNLAYWIQ